MISQLTSDPVRQVHVSQTSNTHYWHFSIELFQIEMLSCYGFATNIVTIK